MARGLVGRKMFNWRAILSIIVIASQATHAGDLDPALGAVLDGLQPDDEVAALVYMVGDADARALDDELARAGMRRAARHEAVVRALQDTAQVSQAVFLEHLDAMLGAGRIASYESFWIANAIHVVAPASVVRELAAHRDVDRVFYDHPIELVAPPTPMRPALPFGGPEPGVFTVRAPAVWSLGFNGSGVLVGSIDTGVDGTHPALASRWAGLGDAYDGHPEWAWFDPHLDLNDFPYDDGSHGTHTMGTICGGQPGDAIGVAPGATWICAAAIDRPGASITVTAAHALASMQWMADPDGDPSTAWDVPHVCNNSWGLADTHGYPDCDELFWRAIDALEASGCIMAFAAGNDGFIGGVRRPADRATTPFNTVAIGAINPHNPSYPIIGFSSRGPTQCTPDGTFATKPDLSGPGQDIRSAIPGGGYYEADGTSMAVAHVSGVIALIRQASPWLTVDQVKEVMYLTAVDLGSVGEDNTYGHGLVDALAAVQLALQLVCYDLTGDATVDSSDLLSLVVSWGECGAGCVADLNEDGWVDSHDMLVLISGWGECEVMPP